MRSTASVRRAEFRFQYFEVLTFVLRVLFRFHRVDLIHVLFLLHILLSLTIPRVLGGYFSLIMSSAVSHIDPLTLALLLISTTTLLLLTLLLIRRRKAQQGILERKRKRRQRRLRTMDSGSKSSNYESSSEEDEEAPSPDWRQLPQVVLVQVFSLLERQCCSERCMCGTWFTVCKRWSAVASTLPLRQIGCMKLGRVRSPFGSTHSDGMWDDMPWLGVQEQGKREHELIALMPSHSCVWFRSGAIVLPHEESVGLHFLPSTADTPSLVISTSLNASVLAFSINWQPPIRIQPFGLAPHNWIAGIAAHGTTLTAINPTHGHIRRWSVGNKLNFERNGKIFTDLVYCAFWSNDHLIVITHRSVLLFDEDMSFVDRFYIPAPLICYAAIKTRAISFVATPTHIYCTRSTKSNVRKTWQLELSCTALYELHHLDGCLAVSRALCVINKHGEIISQFVREPPIGACSLSSKHIAIAHPDSLEICNLHGATIVRIALKNVFSIAQFLNFLLCVTASEALMFNIRALQRAQ
jgi:hypothetical protein